MGVKSTVNLTREQAVSRAAQLYFEAKRRKIEAKFTAMSDSELESKLERLNDKANDGEGFENYSIVPAGYERY